MPMSSRLLFASSNRHKFSEAKNILDSYGVQLSFFPCSLAEIQSNSIKDISKHKAKHAFSLSKKPVIVEDDGLEITSLQKFPGPYSSYVFDTIGNKGILNLLGRNRTAFFVSVITYCDKNNLISFEAKISGKISQRIKGKGWGYDPIFIPKGKAKTFAELDDKNSISHRYNALKKFSKWFLDK